MWPVKDARKTPGAIAERHGLDPSGAAILELLDARFDELRTDSQRGRWTTIAVLILVAAVSITALGRDVVFSGFGVSVSTATAPK